MGLGIGTAAAPALQREDDDVQRSREIKVAALREQYRNGTYQTSAAAISAKLVDSLLKS